MKIRKLLVLFLACCLCGCSGESGSPAEYVEALEDEYGVSSDGGSSSQKEEPKSIKEIYEEAKIDHHVGYTKVKTNPDKYNNLMEEGNLYFINGEFCYGICGSNGLNGTAVYVTMEGDVHFISYEHGTVKYGMQINLEKVDDEHTKADIYIGNSSYPDGMVGSGLHTWGTYSMGDRMGLDKEYVHSYVPGRLETDYIALHDLTKLYDNYSCDIITIDEDGNEEVVGNFKRNYVTPGLGLLFESEWDLWLDGNVKYQPSMGSYFYGDHNDDRANVLLGNHEIRYNLGHQMPTVDVIYDFKDRTIFIDEEYSNVTINIDELISEFK